ncbi:glycosyltransferase family 4 protein [bacterium]|nr:glycosyltransferase family 4 protein [bacterium]
MKILHIDLETSLRGGQKQVINLINFNKDPFFANFLICKKGSGLHEHTKDMKNKYAIRFNGEFDLFAVNAVKKIIKKINPDIIHYHSSHAHSVGYFALKNKKNIKEILTRRVHFLLNNNFITKKKYQRVDRIICISKYIKSIIEKDKRIDNKKLAVIHSGVELLGNDFDISYLENEFILKNNIIKFGMLSALQIDKHKDLLTIFKAINILKSKIQNFVFFLVGSGKDETKLKKIALKMGILKYIIFTGFRKDIGELLNYLDIYVHGVHNEGLGTSIIEAMSTGLPVIATNVGGIPELIENNVNGYLSPASSPKRLSEKMALLMSDKELREKFSKNNMEKAKEFSMEKMAKKNYQLYREIMKKEVE